MSCVNDQDLLRQSVGDDEGEQFHLHQQKMPSDMAQWQRDLGIIAIHPGAIRLRPTETGMRQFGVGLGEVEALLISARRADHSVVSRAFD